MNPEPYPIAGGDYQRAGTASRALKEQLKRIGADPAAVRRAMIAAYEAEMNVVIHSVGGRMKVRLDPVRLDVEVEDDGPGIPDVEKAMEPGFSTAPPAARQMGFGAGLGLPNIRANTDFLAIESAVGRGTRVRFTIYLRRHEARAAGRRSIDLRREKCRRCLRCLAVCPTRAMRVRPAGPEILDHLCIDCTACLAACPSGAITVAGRGDLGPPRDGAVLVVPTAMAGQFGPAASADAVCAALADAGWRHVRPLRPWEDALREAVIGHARDGCAPRPVLSPACPAVVNLVETCFPSLLEHLAPFEPAIEAARQDLAGHRPVLVVSCPGQRTVLETAAVGVEVALPAALRSAIAPRLASARRSPVAPASCDGPPRDESALLCVTGLPHVVRVLEAIENGLMGDVAAAELMACDQGCYGSPLLAEDAFVSQRRSRDAGWVKSAAGPARAVRRGAPYRSRPGLRLDDDMARAIEKLGRIEAIRRGLPGYDCGQCGCPTCAALAEDVVLGRVEKAQCPRKGSQEDSSHESERNGPATRP